MDQRSDAGGNAATPMDAYQCFKRVYAFEIGKIDGLKIYSADGRMYNEVSPEYISKHPLNTPGYYVRYEDGYESFSPKEVFEAGYTLIPYGLIAPWEAESKREMHPQVRGHVYELHNDDASTQLISFLEKTPRGDSILLDLVRHGTTNEAVLQVLIDRLEFLDRIMPSAFNKSALEHLKAAYGALDARTSDRTHRGVEGTTEA